MKLIDVVYDEDRNILEEVELKMLIKKMYEKMKKVLKNREKAVIELRYGLASGISKTQKEIGNMLGISRSYVSRIEKKAIKKLNDEIKDEF
jgi:RNA polymerase sporulation-specific sigma factor